eukprot:14777279-Alexandrium_andersonii.AAC.1
MSASLVGSEMCIRDRHLLRGGLRSARRACCRALRGGPRGGGRPSALYWLSLIHISEPTRLALI